MSNSATRLITLIMLLQSHPSQKGQELAKELGVSPRTLQRYIAMLDEMGIPVCTERGPHGGYSLVRGYKMPPLVLTPEEAVAVCLGTSLVDEMWGQLYRDAAHGALAKLDNVLPDKQRDEVAWARRTLLATHMHRTDYAALEPILESLRSATREQRRIQMQYQGWQQPEPIKRDVDPYALVHRSGWWYFVGYCHLRLDYRLFRVERIILLSLLEDVFERSLDFDVQAFLEKNQPVQPQMLVRLRFMADGTQVALDDRHYWNTLDIQKDGSVEVSFSTSSMETAIRIVMGYGSQVIVLEPKELRNEVCNQARAIEARYLSS